MCSLVLMEATNVAKDDVQPDESHIKSRSKMTDTCGYSQGFHHDIELMELNNLGVPTHELSPEPKSSGPEPPPPPPPPPPLRMPMPKTSPQGSTTEAPGDLHFPVHALANSDTCSLQSSIQPTLFSGLSETTADSEAVSSAKTVSSDPASIPSHSSAFSITKLEDGVFAAPKMALELHDQRAWGKIQPKLNDTIKHTFKPPNNLDESISCEFMMGGPSPTQLKPTVFLVCSHELHRKQLGAFMKKQKWMTAYNYQCVVIVDPIEDLSRGDFENAHRTTELLVEAFMPSGKTSWCGLKARAQSRAHQEPVNFTIGGILMIDRDAFGLTVRHGIDRLIPVYDAGSDNDDHDDNDSGVEDESSPFITFQDAGDTQMPNDWETETRASVMGSRNIAPNARTSLVDNTSPEMTQYGDKWHHFGQFNAPEMVGSTPSRGELDWTFIKFEPRFEVSNSSLVNTLLSPNNDHLQIKSFLHRSNMTGGEVWINAGSTGPVKGWLLDCPALLHRHGKSFEVLQVIPDQALAPGDSGSWVLMADALCGHVLASRKAVPWLYVLPIFEIIAEAKVIMNCQEISLPQHHDHSGPSALANKSFGSGSRDSTIASMSTTTVTGCVITSQQNETSMVLQQWSPARDVTDIMRACLGSLFLERAGLPRLDYKAFENHCRSRLADYDEVAYGSRQTTSCRNAEVFDILQMIRTGLHRAELVDTLGQRLGPGLVPFRFVQERIDRVASLLVMTEIGNITRYGCCARVSWTSGTLQELINRHFTHERALTDTSIRLEHVFTAKSLVQIARLRIFWTSNLSDHLLLDREQSILHIFHHATYLECQRKSVESLLPEGLADETLITLALLFPHSSCSAAPLWLRNPIASDPEHDRFLHSIRMSPLQAHERDIRSFHYWHDRIVILKQAFDETPATRSLTQLWHDRRNFGQWLTLWSVLVFGALSFCFGVVQILLAGLQLRKTAQVGTAAVDQASPTNMPPEPTASIREEGSDYDPGPWTFVGITVGALFITILGGMIIFMLLRLTIWRRKIVW